jgi:hypothetical protein
MDHPPGVAQLEEPHVQRLGHRSQLSNSETVRLPQCHRPHGTVRLKYGFAIGSDYMNVLGHVIIGIDHYAQPAQPENTRHGVSYYKPKRLGYNHFR